MPSKDQRAQIRVLVKAFPQHSRKYEETVCCAGITQTGQLIRLFPIVYRQLPQEQRFDRFDLIEATITQASGDTRPESFRIDQASIRIVESGKRLGDDARVRLWKPHVAGSLDELRSENRRTGRSLGIIQPDAGSLRFFHRSAEEKERAATAGMQDSLFGKALRPLATSEFAFGYRFTSGGRPAKNIILDWEVQAAYIAYLRRYGGKDGALKMLAREYGENIPTRHPHFIMGTMKAHPRTFILIGVLRSGLDPDEVDRQGSLQL